MTGPPRRWEPEDLEGRLRLALADDRFAARMATLRALAELLRVTLEYIVDHRAAIEHGLDVVVFWTARTVKVAPASPWLPAPRDARADEAVDAARRQLLALATEADRGEDRAAWLAIMAGAELCAAALEPLTDLSAAHAVNAARYVLDAMTWPDDDPAQRAQAEARLLELLARHRDAHPKP